MVGRPALALGEIAWRWAFGAAAWPLVIIAIRRILANVDITQAELLLARRSDVFLIADACARIVVQVLPQLGRECLVLAPAIAVLWTFAATVGRAVTLGELLRGDGNEIQRRVPPNWGSQTTLRLLGLNFLRAIFALATLIAFVGALFLPGLAMPAQNPAAAVLAGILVAALIGFFWSVVNWFLALAPVWTVRDGHRALRAIADSVDLCRRGPSSYLGIASWFGLLRAAALVAAFVAGLLASQATPATSIALCVAIALLYFAVADFLYIARLAAYVVLDESTQPSAVSSQPVVPSSQTLVSPQSQ